MKAPTSRGHASVVFRLAAVLLVVLVAGGNVRAAGGKSVRLFGVDYIPAREFGARLGLKAQVIRPAERLRLHSAWTSLDLTVHSVEASLSGTRIFLAEPIVVHRGALHLSRLDAENILRPILAPQRPRALRPLRTIVIDAGHGGADPGNQNRKLRLAEKTFTLDVARRLERLFKAQGYRVVMTRTRDRFVSLEERTAIASRARADLFISIHFNSFAQPGVHGTETYVMTPRTQRSTPQRERDGAMVTTGYPANRNDRWNVVLGYQIHRRLTERLQSTDRGLKHFRYSVLRSVECPAVLVEAAFLSHPAEGRKVSTAAYRQRIADAIAAGVKAYAAIGEPAKG